MANSSQRLKIAAPNHPLPTSVPNLMPFHIAYTGPAPISTYFRVRLAPEPTYGRDARPPPVPLLSSESQESTDSQQTLVADSSTTASSSSVTTLASMSTAVDVDMDADPKTRAETSSSGGRHFVAAFRGRSMHGLEVDLPAGYAGIVLRTPDDKKGKAVARADGDEKPKSKGRSTRRSKRAQEVIEVQDDNVNALEDFASTSEEGPTRVLQPASTFSSFVLWHPDIPVDEGRDEYLRSLTEWTKLAAEIHRVEDY